MTALDESFALTVSLPIISCSTSTSLLFSRVGNLFLKFLIFFLIRSKGELKFIYRLSSFFLFARKLRSNFEPSFSQGYQLRCPSCQQAHGPFIAAGNYHHCLYKPSQLPQLPEALHG